MIRKFGAKQLTEVTVNNSIVDPISGNERGNVNGIRILVSYKTPVAVFDGTTLYRTERRYSVTTSKHIMFYIGELIKAGERFEVVTVPQRVIDNARCSGVVDTAAVVTE